MPKVETIAETLGKEFKRTKGEYTTTDKKRKLLILLDRRKKAHADKDFYYYSKYVLHYNKMAPNPHGEVCEWIQEYPWDDSLLLLPRGTYKSTLRTVAWPLWMLGKNPDLRFFMSSADLANVKGWLNEQRMHMESNEEFRRLYGDWVPRKSTDREKSWTATQLRITPCSRHTGTNTITIGSATVSKVSQHYDIAIVDDLMNDKTSSSIEQINKSEDYLKLLIPILDPQPEFKKDSNGPRHLVGTRWSHDDVYARIIARDKKIVAGGGKAKWRKMIRKAITKDGKVFAPTVLTKKHLHDLKTGGELTNYQFSCQYLNDPQPDSDKMFKLHCMGFWNFSGRTLTVPEMYYKKPGERSKPVNMADLVVIGTADLAGTDNEQSDWTVIVICGIDPLERRRYILEVIRGQWKRPSDIVEQIVAAQLKWSPTWWGIEEIGFKMLVKEGVEAQFQDKRIRVKIEQLKSGNVSKPLRINSIEPHYSDFNMYFRLPEDIRIDQMVGPSPRWGWWYLKEELYNLLDLDTMHVLATELVQHPLSPTNDAADALAYMVPWFRKMKKAKKKAVAVPHGSFAYWQALAKGNRSATQI